MKSVILIATLLAFTGCYKKVAGTFETREEIKLNGKRGTVTLPAARYNANLKVKTKRKFQLVIPGNAGHKFTFRIPRGVSMPRNYGQVRLRASEVGQPYDLSANIDTTQNRSEVRHDTESCSRQVRREVCRYERRPEREVCRQRNGRRVCRRVPGRRVRVCEPEWDTVWGTRDISFREVGKTTSYKVKFMAPNDGRVVARFRGNRYSSDREIISRSRCYLDRRYDRPYWP